MTEVARVAYLSDLASEARKVLNDLKAPYKEKTPISVGKFTSYYGICKHRQTPSGRYKFNIEIAKWLIDTKNEDAIINTIIHEYLHTIDPKAGHKGSWKRWANIVSKNTKYKIERCESYEEKSISEDSIPHNYKVVCENCGNTFYYERLTKFIKTHGKGYRCCKCKENKFKFYDKAGTEI